MISGFLKQLSGTSCVVNNIRAMQNWVGDMPPVHEWFWRCCVIVALFLIVFALTVKHKDKITEICPKNSYLELFLIGLVTIIGPTVLIALSERYQKEVSWGKGYLPAVVSAWGVSLCIALCLVLIASKIKSKVCCLTVLGVIVAATVVPNQVIGEMTVEAAGNWSYIGDNLVHDAEKTGIFEEVKAEEIIVDGNNLWRLVDQQYAYLLQRKVSAISYSQLYLPGQNGLTLTDSYNVLKQQSHFWYMIMLKQYTALVLADCSYLNIDTNDQGMMQSELLADKLYVFVPRDANYSRVIVTFCDGQSGVIELNEDMKYGCSAEGNSYLISLSEAINVLAIEIQ
jgi:hypothetical protein